MASTNLKFKSPLDDHFEPSAFAPDVEQAAISDLLQRHLISLALRSSSVRRFGSEGHPIHLFALASGVLGRARFEEDEGLQLMASAFLKELRDKLELVGPAALLAYAGPPSEGQSPEVAVAAFFVGCPPHLRQEIELTFLSRTGGMFRQVEPRVPGIEIMLRHRPKSSAAIVRLRHGKQNFAPLPKPVTRLTRAERLAVGRAVAAMSKTSARKPPDRHR
jgi:hypothetical protein